MMKFFEFFISFVELLVVYWISHEHRNDQIHWMLLFLWSWDADDDKKIYSKGSICYILHINIYIFDRFVLDLWKFNQDKVDFSSQMCLFAFISWPFETDFILSSSFSDLWFNIFRIKEDKIASTSLWKKIQLCFYYVHLI